MGTRNGRTPTESHFLRMEKFDFDDEDFLAVKIAITVARRLLARDSLSPSEIVGLGHALYALERLPKATDGANCEFGIIYRAGDEHFSEMRYISFTVSGSSFGISQGGSVYDRAVGSDSFTEPGWLVEIEGYSDRSCDLYELEDSIFEFLNLGGKIEVNDASYIEME